MQDFRDKVAVITGGASGIGRAVALLLASEGAHVVIADIEQGPADATAADVRGHGVRSIAVATDVALRESVDGLADRAFSEFGRVDLLMNNAGVMLPRRLLDASAEDWEWVMSVNFHGILNGVYAFVPRMRQQQGERQIVNTASLNGLVARHNNAGVYTASKYAVVGFSYVLREELAEEGIGVSILLPSMMQTGLLDAGRNRQERYGGPFEMGPLPVAPRRPPADPMEMAPRVVQGIRENRRFIFTHPDTREVVEDYFSQIMADYDAAARAADLSAS
jgi:NAD(P)-dependent dehydrogenase (short-subunit alcohol dehydrogenase family)